jgi:peptidoglycan glycosyltransferase
VNRQITRLALTGVGLIVALVVATTYWQAWAAGDLADRQDNQIERVAQFTIKRGEIVGTNPRRILARNRPEKVGGRTLYFRRYPQGRLTAHVVGYSTQSRSRAGLERSLNDYLTGSNANLSTVWNTTLDRLKGATVQGNDVVLTLNLRAQRAALDALDGRCGAVVALQPATGKVLVAANNPTYDPNIFEQADDALGRIDRIQAPCSRPDPLFNRATNGLYAPGSIFKVVTLSAALDTGKYTPESEFVDPGYCIAYGRRVNNYDTTSPFGRLNLRDALVNSVNSVFCNIGKDLGSKKLVEYAKRFGFYSTPPLETPSNERAPSGLYVKNKLFDPKLDSDVDAGRFAFGQERLLVTPLQMAMVAATIANRGVLMRPYVVDRIVSPSGSVVVRTKPEDLGRAVKPETADAVSSMMRDVVDHGTGTRAQISGLPVAGKTGTAETGHRGLVTTWFICFAGRGKNQVAVAVVLEQQSSGSTGGHTAAPVAKEVLQALIGGAANS